MRDISRYPNKNGTRRHKNARHLPHLSWNLVIAFDLDALHQVLKTATGAGARVSASYYILGNLCFVHGGTALVQVSQQLKSFLQQ